MSAILIYFLLAHDFTLGAFHRLRRGEVEAKPTLVALSSGSGKRSSMGESDGLSEYENSTSYEDTDGDTDGERLVTDKRGSSPGKTDDVCSRFTCLYSTKFCARTLLPLRIVFL